MVTNNEWNWKKTEHRSKISEKNNSDKNTQVKHEGKDDKRNSFNNKQQT